jgi:hypothetical protein
LWQVGGFDVRELKIFLKKDDTEARHTLVGSSNYEVCVAFSLIACVMLYLFPPHHILVTKCVAVFILTELARDDSELALS